MVSDAVSPTVTTEQPAPQQPKKRINYALAATFLASGLSFDEIAAKVGAANGNSLRVGLARKGVTTRTTRSLPIPGSRIESATLQVATQAAEMLKDRFNNEIVRQLNQIEAQPCTYDDLPSRGQGRTATVKTLAEAYRSVNGNPDSVTFSFGASVQSSRPELETPQQVVNCGPELDITPAQDIQPVQVVDNAQDSGGSNGA